MAEKDEWATSEGSAAPEYASSEMRKLSSEETEAGIQLESSSAPGSKKDDPVCKHVQKGAQPAVINTKLAKLKGLCSCEECEKARVVRGKAAKKGKGNGAIVTPERPTKSALPKDLWLCLACGCVSCSASSNGGPKQTGKVPAKVPPPMISHVKNHASHKQHPLFLNLGTLDCWCAKCEKGGAFIDYPAASEGLPSVRKESVAGISVHADLEGSAPASQHRLIAECAALVRESQGGRLSGASKVGSNIDTSAARASFPDIDDEDTSVALESLGGGSRIVGFTNLGNTCFFNSVLQNMAAVQPLHLYFQGGQEEGQTGAPAEGPLTAAVRSFYADLSKLSAGAGLETKTISSPGKGSAKIGPKHKGGKNMQRRGGAYAYNPSRLFSAVCTKAPRFKGFEQQDAHELLRYLLDGLDTEELSVRRRTQKSKRGAGLAAGSRKRDTKGDVKSSRSQGGLSNGMPAETEGVIEEVLTSKDVNGPAEESRPASCSTTDSMSEGQSKESTETAGQELEGTTYGATGTANGEGTGDSSSGPSSTEDCVYKRSQEAGERGSEHSVLNGTAGMNYRDAEQADKSSLPAWSHGNGSAICDRDSKKPWFREPAEAPSPSTRDSQKRSGQHPDVTFVERIFGGKLSSTVVCSPCGHSSSVEEPFLDLSLPLPLSRGVKAGDAASPRIKKVTAAYRKSAEAAKKRAQSRTGTGRQVDVQVQGSTESASVEAASVSGASTHSETSGKGLGSGGVESDYAEKAEAHIESAQEGSQPSMEVSSKNEGGAESTRERTGGGDGCLDGTSNEKLSPAEAVELAQSEGEPTSGDNLSLEEGSNRGDASRVENELHNVREGNEEETETSVAASFGGGASAEGTATPGVAQNGRDGDRAGPRQEEDSRDLSEQRRSGKVHVADCDSLPPPAAMSLEGCLFSFTREEVLEGENAVTCEECTKAAREEAAAKTKVTAGKGTKEEIESMGRATEKERSAAEEAERPREAPESCLESSERDHLNGTGLVEGMTDLHLEAQIGCDGKAEDEVRSHFEDASHVTSEEDLGIEAGEILQQSSGAENGMLGHKDEGAGLADVLADSDGFTASSAKQKRRGTPRENGVQPRKETALANGFASLAGEASSDESDTNTSASGRRPESSSEGRTALRRTATKRFLIAETPPILTVHLKRFRQDAKGRLSKIGGHVAFGEWLDLGPYLDRGSAEYGLTKKAETEENALSKCPDQPSLDGKPTAHEKPKPCYRLVGCVEHSGSMRGGHYVAYVRGTCRQPSTSERQLSPEEIHKDADDTWWYISDAHVQRSSLAATLKCEAYLLFFERVD